MELSAQGVCQPFEGWEGSKGASPAATLAAPWGALGLERSIGVGLTWAEMTRPFHVSIPQSVHDGDLGSV